MRALALALSFSLGLLSAFSVAAEDQVVELMASLRVHLDRVRVAPEPSHSEPQPLPDAGRLVGLTREELQKGLGDPSRCRSNNPEMSMAPPCELAGRWVFAFYRLPEGSRGGGLELVLRFDLVGASASEGVSTSSEWRRTQ